MDIVEILLKIQNEYKNGAMAYKSVFGVDHKSALDKAEAIEKAIKALEDQPKYEAALKMMARDDMGHPCRNCMYEVKGETCWKDIPNDCIEGTILYYKNEAGLEVD